MKTTEDIDLVDNQSGRRVPVRLWHPTDPPRGWILFSVGYGGDRAGYAYLGRAWSALGLAVAVVEHVGSNLEVLKSFPQKTRQERNLEVVRRVSEPAELEARPRDLLLAHQQLGQRFAGLPLGLAGHSYGTYTILAAMGLPTIPRLDPVPQPLDGAQACLLISPQPKGMLFSARALAMISIPSLVLTGTKDGPLHGDGDYRDRLEVYDHLSLQLRNLAVLDGVEHMGFAAIGLNLGKQLGAIEGLTGQWWQSTLWGESTPQLRAEAIARGAGTAIAGEYR